MGLSAPFPLPPLSMGPNLASLHSFPQPFALCPLDDLKISGSHCCAD